MIAKLLHANTRYLALVILAILVVGYTSMSGMARKEDPAITPWFAKIQIFFPGASPARVEALITKPMVDAWREEPDIMEVDGTSASGVSLIFVEVALTADIPRAIEPVLQIDREAMPAHEAGTAVFYSISNCQAGLAGISF